MKKFIADTYEALSIKAAEDLIQLMQATEQPLVCTASGDSPAGLYKILVDKAKKNELDLSKWNFVGLDEWAGMNGSDEGSCRYHLNNQLFKPANIPENKICFFNGKAVDQVHECEKTEDFIRTHGGIDVAIVGLGSNGHIGMNEPGTSSTLRSHIADISLQTQEIGQKYFARKGIQDLSKGLTLGLATILKSKHIFLIVSGAHKASIVKEVLQGKISEEVPASLLRNHPSLTIYLDKTAAQCIEL